MMSAQEKTKHERIVEAYGPYVLLISLTITMVFLFLHGFREMAGAIFGMLVVPATKRLMGINGDDSVEFENLTKKEE